MGGGSLIYKDAVTFINACLIKSLFRFNLILPLASFHALWEPRRAKLVGLHRFRYTTGV